MAVFQFEGKPIHFEVVPTIGADERERKQLWTGKHGTLGFLVSLTNGYYRSEVRDKTSKELPQMVVAFRWILDEYNATVTVHDLTNRDHVVNCQSCYNGIRNGVRPHVS